MGWALDLLKDLVITLGLVCTVLAIVALYSVFSIAFGAAIVVLLGPWL